MSEIALSPLLKAGSKIRVRCNKLSPASGAHPRDASIPRGVFENDPSEIFRHRDLDR